MYQPSAPCAAPSRKATKSAIPSRRPIRPRTANQTAGTAKTTPIRRPQSRWRYSSQKIERKSSTVIQKLTRLNSGVSR